jgi:hypothetical protein
MVLQVRATTVRKHCCGPLDPGFAGILIDRPAGGLTGINAFGAML